MKRANVYIIYDFYSDGFFVETRKYFVGEMYGEEYNRVLQIVQNEPDKYRNVKFEDA